MLETDATMFSRNGTKKPLNKQNCVNGTKRTHTLETFFFLLLRHYNRGSVWAENTKLRQLSLTFARSRQLYTSSADTSYAFELPIGSVGALASVFQPCISKRRIFSLEHRLPYLRHGVTCAFIGFVCA